MNNHLNNRIVKLYGEQAERIEEGDMFYATVTTVEGRKVVNLLRAKTDKIFVLCEGEIAKDIRCDTKAKRTSPAGICLCNSHGLRLFGKDAWFGFPTIKGADQ